MARGRKTGADAVQAAAMGHNQKDMEAMERDCIEFVARKTLEIQTISAEIKEKLREGKEVGVLKQAIRKAVKNLLMTSEQRSAKQEVEAETMRMENAYRDLPLFSGVAAEAA